MLVGKFQSVMWFLRRPQLYGQFVHLIKQKLLIGNEPDTHQEAVHWCEQRAVDSFDAIALITGEKPSLGVEQMFPTIFAEARERARTCPTTMGGPGGLDLLYHLASLRGAERVIETGVAYGWSSLALLLALHKKRMTKLISTDMPYVRSNNDRFVGVVVPAELRDHWELIRLADRQALPMALKKLHQIDLCHYDSDKSYAGRMWAYPKLWSALKPGGVFISDDIGDNLGFRDFATQIRANPIVVRVGEEQGDKFVGILIKPAP